MIYSHLHWATVRYLKYSISKIFSCLEVVIYVFIVYVFKFPVEDTSIGIIKLIYFE